MNLTVKLKALKYIVDLVSTVTPTRTTLPSLSAVLLAYDDCKLTACASDLRSFARAHCEAIGEQSGAFGVRADLLSCFLGGCSAEDVEITVDQRATFQCGTMRAVLSVMKADEFQAHPDVAGYSVSLPAKVLYEGLGKALHAASDDFDQKMTLCSVAFDFSPTLNMVAFNGVQLAVVKTTAEGSGQYIASRLYVGSLLKALGGAEGDVNVTFAPNLIRVECADWSISGLLLSGNFPRWENVERWADMPKFTFKRDDLLAAFRSCIPFGEAGFTRIRVEGDGRIAVVEIAGENASRDEVPYQGTPFLFFVDGKKMISLLNVLTADTVTLEYKDEKGVGIVVHEDNFTAAIMPLEK